MPLPQPRGQMSPEQHRAKMLLALVPEEIRKSAGNAEIARRLNEYQRLSSQAHDGSLSGPLRHEAFIRAGEVMSAPLAPRAVPQDRTAAVRKAKPKDEEFVPVFDQGGNLVGIAKPTDIITVAGPGKPKEPATDAEAGDALAEDSEVTKALLNGGAAKVYRDTGAPVLATRIRGFGSSRLEKASDVITRHRVKQQPVRKAATADRRVNVCNRYGRQVGTIMQSEIRPIPRDTTSRIAKASLAGYVNVYNSAGAKVGIAPRSAVRLRSGS